MLSWISILMWGYHDGRREQADARVELRRQWLDYSSLFWSSYIPQMIESKLGLTYPIRRGISRLQKEYSEGCEMALRGNESSDAYATLSPSSLLPWTMAHVETILSLIR